MTRSWGTPTDGLGSRTAAHMNLKRSLADVWGTDEGHVRLRSPDGRYLHKDGQRLTLVKADAWLGPRAEATPLIERMNNLVRVA